MVYIVAASFLYHSLEQLSNPEKEEFLPKILAIPGLSLNPNTTNPQKNLASLLCRAPLTKNVKWWYGTTSSIILSTATAKTVTELAL